MWQPQQPPQPGAMGQAPPGFSQHAPGGSTGAQPPYQQPQQQYMAQPQQHQYQHGSAPPQPQQQPQQQQQQHYQHQSYHQHPQAPAQRPPAPQQQYQQHSMPAQQQQYQQHQQHQQHQQYQQPQQGYQATSGFGNINYGPGPGSTGSPPRKAAAPDVVNMFDPLAAPVPITAPKMDPASVLSRVTQFHQRGMLSAQEHQCIAAQVSIFPSKITLALDKLEIGDRSGVFELSMNGGAPPAPRPVAPQQPVASSIPPASAWAPSSGEWGAPNGTPSSSMAAGGAKEDDDDDDDDFSDSDSEAGGSGARTVMGSEGDGSEDFEIAKRLQEQYDEENRMMRAPHPAAGGFKTPVPASFVLVNGEMLGKVHVRVSSKKLFRKWKEVFFVMTGDRVSLYDSSIDFEARREPKIVYHMHACMYIRKPAIKETYSIMDDSRRIFYTTFRENVAEDGSGASSGRGGNGSQSTYSFEKKSHRICKFGAHDLNDISAFAHGMHGVILAKRREKSLALTGSVGRYT